MPAAPPPLSAAEISYPDRDALGYSRVNQGIGNFLRTLLVKIFSESIADSTHLPQFGLDVVDLVVKLKIFIKVHPQIFTAVNSFDNILTKLYCRIY